MFLFPTDIRDPADNLSLLHLELPLQPRLRAADDVQVQYSTVQYSTVQYRAADDVQDRAGGCRLLRGLSSPRAQGPARGRAHCRVAGASQHLQYYKAELSKYKYLLSI